jgi:hypothetical protein
MKTKSWEKKDVEYEYKTSKESWCLYDAWIGMGNVNSIMNGRSYMKYEMTCPATFKNCMNLQSSHLRAFRSQADVVTMSISL